MAFESIRLFFKAKRDAKSFNALTQKQRKIVFYAEDTHSMVHFEEIIKALTRQDKNHVCYLTSVADDPVLHTPFYGMKAFYIGEGIIRTTVFRTLKAQLMIMTMPDLDNFHIKRSQVYPVHYLYLFHAMVSTHSNYRQAAFDHYDTVFCTGTYQIEEIRETERVYSLKPKHLYSDGYRRLESIIEDVKIYRQKQGDPSDDGKKTVIVAPSWGDNAILESCGIEIISCLIAAGYRTIVRPHPMTSKHKPELIDAIKKQFSSYDNFELQIDIRNKKALYESHVMISDWSGVTMEYAFSCERPVLFIDVPKKCNNPEADRINIEPIEASIRTKIGSILSPQEIDKLPEAIEELYHNSSTYTDKIRRARIDNVFNLGESLEGAVKEIINISEQLDK